jgi:glutathione S-transferase
MYALYIANRNYSSWSLRPWVLLKTLSIEFEECFVPFLEGATYEEFRKFSPTGLVPCLVDGDLTVWDSLSITEYLAEAHSEIWPSDREARAWARSASAEMHSGFSALRNVCGMNVGVRVRLHEQSDALKANLARLDELWTEGLDRFGGPFLALPAMQEWYEAGVAETIRDLPHDAEIGQVGTLVEDLRAV